MSGMKNLRKGIHRRGQSLYKFTLGEMGIEHCCDEKESEEPGQIHNIEGFDWSGDVDVSCLTKINRDTDNKSKLIIVEPLEHDFYEEDRQGLGLKFSRLKERTEDTMILCNNKSIFTGAMAQNSETPKIMDFKIRLANIKGKYDVGLQKIDEEINEMSLIKSKNSLSLINTSTQSKLSSISFVDAAIPDRKLSLLNESVTSQDHETVLEHIDKENSKTDLNNEGIEKADKTMINNYNTKKTIHWGNTGYDTEIIRETSEKNYLVPLNLSEFAKRIAKVHKRANSDYQQKNLQFSHDQDFLHKKNIALNKTDATYTLSTFKKIKKTFSNKIKTPKLIQNTSSVTAKKHPSSKILGLKERTRRLRTECKLVERRYKDITRDNKRLLEELSAIN